MDYAKESLRLHKEWKGKIEVVTRVPAENKEDLSLAYTPGVAQPCLIVIAMPMQQIQHREFSRQRVGVGQMQVAGRERRQRHLNIYRVAQRVGEKITMHLCHDIPS